MCNDCYVDAVYGWQLVLGGYYLFLMDGLR